MQQLVELALKQRVLMMIAAVALLVWGGYSFTQLPIEAYPDVMNAQVQVITQWPGHAAEEVEKLVTVPLETSLNGVPGVQSVRSRSLFGLSVVYLQFNDGVEDYFARQRVAEQVSQVNLPAGLQPNYSPLSSATGEIYRYTLVGADLTTLRTLQDWTVTRRLRSIPGVADVSTFGGLEKEYQIQLDPARLRARGVTIKQVTDAVVAANASAGGGFIEHGSEEYVVRGLGLFRDTRDIESVTVTSMNGTPLTVRDVASVHIGARPRLGKVGWRVGQSQTDVDDAVLGLVLLRRGESPDAVLEEIHKTVEHLNDGTRLPEGVRIVPLLDRSDLVHTTTRTVEHNLIEGVTLVLLALLLFLGNFRAALIVALTIPISLLFAFSGMNGMHVPANLLSLGAIDFGILVNGTVILVEAICRRLAKRGEDETTAACILDAVREVQTEVVVTTFIILLAYLPLFTMEGVARKMFAPMAVTIGLALVGSLLMAVLIAPALSLLLLSGKVKAYEPRWLRALTDGYARALDGASRRPVLVLVVAAALVAFALAMLPRLGTEFLPHLDEGNLWVRMEMPTTISQTEATRMMPKLREIFARYQPVRLVTSQNGRPDDGTDATGFYNAEFLVDLKPYNEWQQYRSKAALVEAMQKEVGQIPGVTFNFSQAIEDNVEEAATGVKGELAVKIFGDDLRTLEMKADEVQKILASIPGVVDLDTFKETGEPQVAIRVDRAKVARYGMSVQDVQDTVETAIGGKPVTQLLDGERKFDVTARLIAPARADIGAISNISVPTPNGQRVPLSQVATISSERGASFVYRESGQRFIAIKFGVRGRDIGGTVIEAQRKVAAAVKLPTGYYTAWGGEFESMERAQARLAIIAPLTLGLIFIVLYALFNSVSRALLAMMNVPLALVGGTVALGIAGMHLSIAAAVGFIALFGVAIQNGVIMLSHLDHLCSSGLPLKDAIRQASVDRLRAVTATAALASIGLIPAAISTGIGSDTQKPLAVVIIGGILSSTLLTLFVLPVAYGMVVSRERRVGASASVLATIALLLLPTLLLARHVVASPMQSAQTFLAFGRAALRRGRWDEAEKQFRYALAYGKQHGGNSVTQAYIALADVYIRTGRATRATEVIDVVKGVAPNNPEALRLEKQLADDPDLNEARGVIEAQVKSEPRNAEAKAILAGLLLHVKKDDEAKTMARAALAQDPQESHAQAILAQITTREGDDAGARHMFEQALRYDKNNDHLLGSLGEILLRQKDGAAAAKYLRKAVSFAPEHRHWRELLDEANEMIGAGAATSATDKIPVTQKTPIMEKTPN